METIRKLVKNHQQKLVLIVGFVLVAGIAFLLGRNTGFKSQAPDVRVEEMFSAPSNYTSNASGIQSGMATTNTTTGLNCEGKIKGSSSLTYHLPGGAFYTRTTKPIRCFDTEAEAVVAGFKKSAK